MRSTKIKIIGVIPGLPACNCGQPLTYAGIGTRPKRCLACRATYQADWHRAKYHRDNPDAKTYTLKRMGCIRKICDTGYLRLSAEIMALAVRDARQAVDLLLRYDAQLWLYLHGVEIAEALWPDRQVPEAWRQRPVALTPGSVACLQL